MVLMQESGHADAGVAAVVTLGDRTTVERMATECEALACAGASVRVLFRDEGIPAICLAEVRIRINPRAANVESVLASLAAAGDVRLYACSSSLYVWGVAGEDLLPAVAGVRGLIAFLADDLAGASKVLSY